MIGSPAGAQSQPIATDSTAPQNLFTRSDLYILGAFTAGTLAMFPLDRQLASVVRADNLVANENLKRASSAIRFFGGSGPFLIGGAMYVAGRLAHNRRTADLALHGTEAVVVAGGVSGVLKVILGRARPYLTSDTNPRDFGFGRGLTKGSDYESFPSGHSTAAFAAAAAVSTETAAWWPQTRWIFGPILYGGASLVGLSRMYDDKHWASDVVLGAAVGTFAGLKVVRFNHTHEGNRLDRWFLGDGTASRSTTWRLVADGNTVGVVANIRW